MIFHQLMNEKFQVPTTYVRDDENRACDEINIENFQIMEAILIVLIVCSC